jgi:DNA-binding GntR family transcriptional regulator
MKAGLQHRTLSAAIAEQLRQAILAGDFAAGVQLRQDALAAQFGVSRIPLREALFQLEAEGLIHIEAHKGAVVLGFARDEIDDVFELRLLLEPRLLERSIARMTAADYEEVARLDAAFDIAIAQKDIARWGQLNAQLHMSLYRHAELPRTLAVVGALLQSSDRYTRLQLNRDTALTRAQREHRKLIALCRAGEASNACAYLVSHIDSVRKDIHRLLNATAAEPQAKVRRKSAAT